MPAASFRIIPARSISWWLGTSASEGISFNVGNKYREYRISVLLLSGFINNGKSTSTARRDQATGLQATLHGAALQSEGRAEPSERSTPGLQAVQKIALEASFISYNIE
jgi:hypothetical protein